MKAKLIYIYTLGIAAALAGCSEDFTYPPMIVPTASMQPNTTIAQMKQLYWSSDRNYCSNIRELSDGTDMIIKGRVVSTDSTGNVFKNVIIEDETAAITIAINAYDLYNSYQYGQNIVVNVTGLQIGGYNGLMQIGSESSYNGSPSMTFMTKDVFERHAEPDGLSNPKLVVPEVYTIAELSAIKSNQTSLCLTQSKLVKIDNVSFVDAGKQFAPTATTDRYVVDASGNRLNVRCSSYSTFKDDYIPSGTGSVTGILSYYGSDWQLILNSLDGLQGFEWTGPIEPEPTPAQGVVYSGLTANADGWTADNVIMAPELTYVWMWDTSYNYLKASAYKGAATAADSYYTTTVDLSGYKTASMQFMHVSRYVDNPSEMLTLVARVSGAKDWTKVTIPTYSDGKSWDMVSSGTIDISAFAGKKVDLGFRYTSTASAAATWEVKDLKISATK